MTLPSPIDLAKDSEWQADQIARESNPANRVTVPERLTKPSPLLAPTIAAVNSRRRTALARDRAHRTDGKPLDYAYDFDGLLFRHLPMGFRVTVGSADRAILIVDTLIKACEARGLNAFAGKDGLRIGYGDHSARVRVSERVEQVHGGGKKPATMDRRTPFIAHNPTSQLTLFVERMGAARKVVDKPGLPLHDQVNAAIVLVCRAIAETEAWRDYLEEKIRLSKEKERAEAACLAEIEASRAEVERSKSELFAEAEAWQKASTLRLYVDNIVAASVSGSPGAAEWASWARKLADELDPTLNRVITNG